jgi:hypothetical protein
LADDVARLARLLQAMPPEWIESATVEKVAAVAGSRFGWLSWERKSLILAALKQHMKRT